MIISYVNHSNYISDDRVGLYIDLELDVLSFAPITPKHNTLVSYSGDRRSHRATHLNTANVSTVTFCKITEDKLKYVYELIYSTAHREYMSFDNQGHTGHPAGYNNVLCTSNDLSPKRIGQLYTLAMPIEVHD